MPPPLSPSLPHYFDYEEEHVAVAIIRHMEEQHQQDWSAISKQNYN